MKPEKVKLRVKLGGRTYVFETWAPYEPMIRQAVARLNERYRMLRNEYALDEADVLSMLLLEVVAQREKDRYERLQAEKQWEAEWQKTDQLLNEIDQIITGKEIDH